MISVVKIYYLEYLNTYNTCSSFLLIGCDAAAIVLLFSRYN